MKNWAYPISDRLQVYARQQIKAPYNSFYLPRGADLKSHMAMADRNAVSYRRIGGIDFVPLPLQTIHNSPKLYAIATTTILKPPTFEKKPGLDRQISNLYAKLLAASYVTIVRLINSDAQFVRICAGGADAHNG